MASVPNPMQIIQEMFCSEKLSKVSDTIQEAINVGVSPQKVDEVVQSVLDKYRPFPDENYLKGTSIPADVAALHIPSHIANTDSSLSYTQKLDAAQRVINAAAATTYPNAGSLAHGLPYHTSALGLNNELVEAAREAQGELQDEQERQQQEPSQVSASFTEGLADDELYLTLNSNKATKIPKATEVPKPPVTKLSSAEKQPTPKPSPTNKGASPKQPAAAIATSSKQPAITAASSSNPTTPAKRGRPVGHHKQVDGEIRFPYGTRAASARSKSKSANISGGGEAGDKKRKADPVAASASKPSRKRQRRAPASADGEEKK